MKKNTKGFTLIELLAVIVILAIIALIAVPVILNILEKSRVSAAADTCYSVLNAAELYYAEELLEHPTEAFVEQTLSVTDSKLQLKGNRPDSGSVKINANGSAQLSGEVKVGEVTCTQADANSQVVCDV